MKIMIEIPDEVYVASQIVDVEYEDVMQIPLEVIANGVPIDELIQEIKPEFLNEEVVRETNWQTVKSRSYAKGWNDCNCYYIETIMEEK